MEKIRIFSVGFMLSFLPSVIHGQIPYGVDPGNARGEEGTLYLWEKPEIYVPVLLVVGIALIIFGYQKKKRKKTE
jgi:hypothetical protein